ncbi:MAG TPA: hypothetical protein VGF77_05235 [Allosphingosinicella sp.]|jgi:hypothetical protein
MMNLGRRAAALGSLLAFLWPGALAAQDNTTVGNPQLRNFQLPGQRTTPPAQPQPVAPAPVPTLAAPPASSAAPARQAAPRSTVPADRTTTRAAVRPPALPPKPAAPESRSTASRRPPAPPAVAPPTATAPVAQTEPAPPPAAPPGASRQSPAPAPFNLAWLLALPVLLGLAAAGWFLRRRIGAREEAETLADAVAPGERKRPGAPAAPELLLDHVASPEPAAELLLDEVAPRAGPAETSRPWLQLDIEPDRAAATESEASLHYNLVVTNVGGETARNIRIDTRMFNAADEPQIAAFLGGAIHRHSGSPYINIPPGESLRLTAEIAMKAEEVRAIELQGRSIFVPTVAINVAYDWAKEGEGRTSKSWLVGRKSEDPNARMGAFRLDLGPRIYRSVGRKDTKLVMV